jgi:hypothetical protein
VGRVTVKGGYYGADEDALDDGWISGLSWMQFMSPNFATEFEIGYLDVEGKDGGIQTDVWGFPSCSTVASPFRPGASRSSAARDSERATSSPERR